jgi:Tfp pilus assembly protein PilF
VQVGYQALADRYTYLPQLGVFTAVAWGLPAPAGRLPRNLRLAAVALALAVCLVLTRRQLAVWHDNETLFAHALQVTRDNWLAHTEVGNALMARGDPAGAERQYRAALAIRPDYPAALHDLGTALLRQRRFADAIAPLRRALELRPSAADTWNNLGSALFGAGDAGRAAACFERALALDPHLPGAPANLELARSRQAQAPSARPAAAAPGPGRP